MPVIADDLFAGAGGWDLAAEALGITARGIENDPAARATREAAGLSTIHDDVWTYAPDGLAQGLIASPPCQTFSRATNGTGRKALTDVTQALATDAYTDKGELRALAQAVGDQRTALVLLPMHYATQHGHYRWLAWEQVPTVLPVWEACAAILRELGWRVWVGLVHAEQHGVPQARTRAVLLAVQDGEALPPVPTHSLLHRQAPDRLDEGVLPWVTMAQGLPHRTDLPTWCHHRPATTVMASFFPDVVASPGYRTTVSRQNAPDSVRINVAEAAALQGFPAGYPWQGGPKGGAGPAFLQVGNAIPPPLAAAVLAQAVGASWADTAATTDTDAEGAA